MNINDFLYIIKILKFEKIKCEDYKLNSDNIFNSNFKMNSKIEKTLNDGQILKGYIDSYSFCFSPKEYCVYVDGRKYTEYKALINFLIFNDLTKDSILKGYFANNFLEIIEKNDITTFKKLILNDNFLNNLRYYFPTGKSDELSINQNYKNELKNELESHFEFKVPFIVSCKDVYSYNEIWMEYRFNYGEYIVKMKPYPAIKLDDNEMYNLNQLKLVKSL